MVLKENSLLIYNLIRTISRPFQDYLKTISRPFYDH